MESNFAWACASVVGVVFIFAGIQKLLAGIEWLVQAKQLRPPRIAQPFVPLVPYIELSGGWIVDSWSARNARADSGDHFVELIYGAARCSACSR